MQQPRHRIDAEHPLGGEMSDVLRGLVHRFQLTTLQQRHASVPLLATFSFVNGCLSIALMSIVALVTDAPFIFPSLGPTAFLFFFTPTAPAAAPRNTLTGHAIGAAAGWLALQVTGLGDAGPALAVGVTWERVIAAGLSLGLTSGLMVLFRSPHPPAGATTLIVSLGLLPHLWQLGVLMLAVAVLTVQAFCINRLAGLPYPLWSAPAAPAPPAVPPTPANPRA